MEMWQDRIEMKRTIMLSDQREVLRNANKREHVNYLYLPMYFIPTYVIPIINSDTIIFHVLR
jgi:hypothetical protein